MVWSHRAGLDGHGLCTCVGWAGYCVQSSNVNSGPGSGVVLLVKGLHCHVHSDDRDLESHRVGHLQIFCIILGSQIFRRLSGIYSYWNSGRTVPLVLPISLSSHFFPDSNSHFSESTRGSLPVSLLNPQCYWFSIYFLFIYQHIITCKDITLLFATILALPYLSWQMRNPVCWNPYWNFNSSERRKFKWDFSLWNAQKVIHVKNFCINITSTEK